MADQLPYPGMPFSFLNMTMPFFPAAATSSPTATQPPLMALPPSFASFFAQQQQFFPQLWAMPAPTPAPAPVQPTAQPSPLDSLASLASVAAAQMRAEEAHEATRSLTGRAQPPPSSGHWDDEDEDEDEEARSDPTSSSETFIGQSNFNASTFDRLSHSTRQEPRARGRPILPSPPERVRVPRLRQGLHEEIAPRGACAGARRPTPLPMHHPGLQHGTAI